MDDIVPNDSIPPTNFPVISIFLAAGQNYKACNQQPQYKSYIK